MTFGEKERVADEFNNVHTITKILGQGGQGAVYRTTDPDIAIKFAQRGGQFIEDEAEVKYYNNMYERKRLIAIPKDINIALPSILTGARSKASSGAAPEPQ